MSNAKEIARNVVITVLWVIIALVICLWLTGCLALEKQQDRRTGGFSVSADCEKNKVDVTFDLQQEAEGREGRVTK